MLQIYRSCLKSLNIYTYLPKRPSKVLHLILLLILSSKLSYSQDIIYKTDGIEIKAKVIEITVEVVKYKKYEQLNGPLRNIDIKEIFMIIYEDGTREVFKNQDKEEKIEEDQNKLIDSMKENKIEQERPIRPNTKARNSETNYSSQTLISFGYGNSYGGLGVNLGISTSMITPHIGVGWFPLSIVAEGADDMFMVSGGTRFFFNKLGNKSRGYLDVQFGMLGGEYNELSLYQGGSLVYQTKKQQALYGPSILLGTEGFWGKGNIGGRIAGGGSYNLAEIEWIDIGWLWALDIGLVIKL